MMTRMPASIRVRAALLAEWTVIFGARKRVKTDSSIHSITSYRGLTLPAALKLVMR